MKTLKALAGLAAICWLFSHQAVAHNIVKLNEADVIKVTSDWPGESKKALTAMIEKYGQPNQLTENMAIWNGNGPWKRTIV